MEEQFNKEAKERWRFAARINEETTGSEDQKRSSGGVFVAIDSNLGAVVEEEEGAIESIPGNEGRIAQAWVNVGGGLRIFSVHFWHSERWTPRNEALVEAVLKRARTTRHPWLIACDANMCPEDSEKSLWFQRETMHEVAPKGDVQVERPKRGKISHMEMVEDFEPRLPLWLRKERRCRIELSEAVSTHPSAQTLLVNSFQFRHRHSIVMTLHIHVGSRP